MQRHPGLLLEVKITCFTNLANAPFLLKEPAVKTPKSAKKTPVSNYPLEFVMLSEIPPITMDSSFVGKEDPRESCGSHPQGGQS